MMKFDITLLFQIINFLVMILILVKLLYKPILGILEKRKNLISNSLATAEKEKKEANDLLNSYKSQLAKAKDEAGALIKDAQVISEKIKNEQKVATEKETIAMIAKAKQEIEREKEQALLALKKEVLDLSIQVASKILEKEINASTHRQLIDKFIEEAGRTKW